MKNNKTDNSSSPCRIGAIDGKPVLLWAYPTYVIISMGGEQLQFPSRDAALLYLQQITLKHQRETETRVNHDYPGKRKQNNG